MLSIEPGRNHGSSEPLTLDDSGLGVVDHVAEQVFTRGQCHALALALVAERADATLGAWVYRHSWSADPEDTDLSAWDHCAAILPDGRCVDIYGAMAPEDTEWHRDMELVPITEEEFCEHIDPEFGGSGYPLDHDAAVPFARAILSALEV